MMLIGTSLGGCLKSLMEGEVSEEDVLVIITRTECGSLEKLINTVKAYYREGNPFSSRSSNYVFEKDSVVLEKLVDLTEHLYKTGRIHQPRIFGLSHVNFIHDEITRKTLWLEVSPILTNANPAVVDAWSKYKMLDNLTKDE